jgi:hypothetical protein
MLPYTRFSFYKAALCSWGILEILAQILFNFAPERWRSEVDGFITEIREPQFLYRYPNPTTLHNTLQFIDTDLIQYQSLLTVKLHVLQYQSLNTRYRYAAAVDACDVVRCWRRCAVPSPTGVAFRCTSNVRR